MRVSIVDAVIKALVIVGVVLLAAAAVLWQSSAGPVPVPASFCRLDQFPESHTVDRGGTWEVRRWRQVDVIHEVNGWGCSGQHALSTTMIGDIT